MTHRSREQGTYVQRPSAGCLLSLTLHTRKGAVELDTLKFKFKFKLKCLFIFPQGVQADFDTAAYPSSGNYVSSVAQLVATCCGLAAV